MNGLEVPIYSVSQVNALIKTTLETSVGLLAVQGEVSGFRNTKERLIYFELKDKEARILCFMMVWDLKVSIEDGMEIKIYGVPSVFAKSGGLHIRVHEIELVGEGALKRAFEKLCKKLELEGLFLEERKRAIPEFPERIGLITSSDAAAYTDVLRVLGNRWGGLQIIFCKAGVQGYGAAESIVQAFKYFNKIDHVDVLILTRGGGSLEDLQTFNTELVARAIYGSRAPVICGVGHERDVTIADFVADVRAATPSNAAELCVPDRNQINYRVNAFVRRLERSITEEQNAYHRGIANAVSALERPIGEISHGLKRHVHQMATMIKQTLINAQRSVITTERVLASLNPRAILKRGYAVVRKGKHIISTTDKLAMGDAVAVELHKGAFESIVTKTI